MYEKPLKKKVCRNVKVYSYCFYRDRNNMSWVISVSGSLVLLIPYFDRTTCARIFWNFDYTPQQSALPFLRINGTCRRHILRYDSPTGDWGRLLLGYTQSLHYTPRNTTLVARNSIGLPSYVLSIYIYIHT